MNSSVLVYMEIKQAAFFLKVYLVLFIIVAVFYCFLFYLRNKEEESALPCASSLSQIQQPGLGHVEANHPELHLVGGTQVLEPCLLAPRMPISRNLDWKRRSSDFH